MKYILLSYRLSLNTPAYGKNPPIKIITNSTIATGDACNTYLIKIHNHSGTHIDAPRHFWDKGRSIADYDLNELIFNHPLVIECSKSPKEMISIEDLADFKKKLRKCDILLIKTGFWKYRDKRIYRLENPGILPEVASYIRSEFENVRCVGIDSISVSSCKNRELGRKTHNIFLKKGRYKGDPILLLEDLDLSRKDLDKLKTILICPLMIENIDSAPCTVVGVFE